MVERGGGMATPYKGRPPGGEGNEGRSLVLRVVSVFYRIKVIPFSINHQVSSCLFYSSRELHTTCFWRSSLCLFAADSFANVGKSSQMSPTGNALLVRAAAGRCAQPRERDDIREMRVAAFDAKARPRDAYDAATNHRGASHAHAG